MFKKKEDEKKTDTASPRDEHAYEDSWYRSLKALREQGSDDEGTIADAKGSAGGDDEPAAEELPDPDPDPEPETEAEAEPEAEAVETEVPDPAITDVEARAGELLERLRTLQHLGDQ